MALFDENANTIRFTEIDFQGQEALFTEARVKTDTIPLPLKKYEVEYAYERSWGSPTVRKEVESNFLGTLITPEPIDDLHEGETGAGVELYEGETDFYTGKYTTLAGFIERHDIDAKPRSGTCMRDIDGIEFVDEFAGSEKQRYHLSLDGLHLMQDGRDAVFEKRLQTNRNAYFAWEDEKVMFATSESGGIGEFLYDNHLAEVGFLDSVEIILARTGDEKVTYMDDFTRSFLPEFSEEYGWKPSEVSAAKLAFYDVHVQGTRALHTEHAILPESVPKALHVYEVDSDPGNPDGKLKLSKRAYVNFAGTLIAERPLDLGEDGRIYLDPKDVSLRSDRPITLKEFAREVGVRIKPPKDRER